VNPVVAADPALIALELFLKSPTLAGGIIALVIAFVAFVIRVTAAATRVAVASEGLLKAVVDLGEKDRADHLKTREVVGVVSDKVGKVEAALQSHHDGLRAKIDTVQSEVTKAVGVDGDLTREALADHRFSALQAAVANAVDADPPSTQPAPKRSRTGSHPALRGG
jgi:hypothetical protein